MRFQSLAALSFVLLSIERAAPPVSAAPFDIERKITASAAAAHDEFGSSVSISGGTAIVGAPQYLYTGSGKPGAAFLIDISSAAEITKLTALDASADDWFGSSVGISGDRAIIGAGGDDSAGSNSGSAYLFDVYSGAEVFKFTASDGTSDDMFGLSVAIDGDRAVIGAPGYAFSGTSAGAAYLFDVVTGNETSRLVASDAAIGDHFGSTVSISGDRALVGAHRHNNSSGAAYIFDAATGNELLKLTALDAAADDHFGEAIAISGDRAIIGAPHDDSHGLSSGSAYIFDVATGMQLFKLAASDASGYNYFGGSVAISGCLAFVGADGNSNDRGAAYVFDVTTGQQLVKLTANDGVANQRIGDAVAIDGTSAIIGARLTNSHGTFSGAAYLFTPEPSTGLLLGFGLLLPGLGGRCRWS